jgi:hypothetical protein
LQKTNTLRYFVSRLNCRRPIFESSAAQQDLNHVICLYSSEAGAIAHLGGRLSVMRYETGVLADVMISKG